MPRIVDSDGEDDVSVMTEVSQTSLATGIVSEAGDLASEAGESLADDGEFRVTEETDTRRGQGNPARHWVFTIHAECPENPELDVLRKAWTPPSTSTTLKYIVCQKELGSGTLRLHWQGYVQFSRPIRAPSVRQQLGASWAWVRPAKGTPQQARAYCTKEDTRVAGTEPYEMGRIVEMQGKRNDLADVYDMIRGGAAPVAVLEANPSAFMRYHRGIQAATHLVRTAAASTTLRDVEVIVVWGPPGSGKTRWVWETYGGASMYTLSITGSTVWWDGYDMQETVLMDDFAGQIPFRSLLNYTDRYPVQCPVKGAMVWLNARRIILTSNLHWSVWYQHDPAGRKDLDALRRRITMVRHVPAWGAEHVVETRGADPTDQARWVTLPEPTPHAPGFVVPQQN